MYSGVILWMCPADERRRYIVTLSLIGRSHHWGDAGSSILPCGRQGTVYPAYRKTTNISRTLVGTKIVDNSDVVGASPVGAAPTTSSFST